MSNPRQILLLVPILLFGFIAHAQLDDSMGILILPNSILPENFIRERKIKDVFLCDDEDSFNKVKYKMHQRYNKAGSLILNEKGTEDNDNGSLNNFRKIYYNENGKVQAMIKNYFTRGRIYYDTIRISYTETGKLKETVEILGLINGSTPDTLYNSTTYDYDAQGRIVKKYMIGFNRFDYTIATYVYDLDGRLSKFSAQDNAGKELYAKEHFYDKTGIEIQTISWEGGIKTENILIYYDKLYRVFKTEKKDRNDSLVNINSFSYDKKNRMSECYTKHRAEGEWWGQVTTYKYDKKTGALETIIKTTDAGDLIEKQKYFYDAAGIRIKTDYYNSLGDLYKTERIIYSAN